MHPITEPVEVAKHQNRNQLENYENRHRRFRVTRFLLKHMKRLRKSLEKDCLRLSQVYRKYQGISYSLQYEQKKQRV